MRSMVEGWLPGKPRVGLEAAKACVIYPSTTPRVVPLPIFDGEDYPRLNTRLPPQPISRDSATAATP
jgi:hypothetical protein